MAKINSRSPYFINEAQSGLQEVRVKIWIYSGSQYNDGNRPATPTYSLFTNAIDEKASIDISGLVDDYLATNFDGIYFTRNYWVDYQVILTVNNTIPFPVMYQSRGFYGYGYFEDGINPENNQGLLQSNTEVLKFADTPVVVPVDTSITTSVAYLSQGEIVYSDLITPSTSSSGQIKYVTSGVNGADFFESRVILSGGSFEGSSCLPSFEDEFDLFDFDSIHVSGSDGLSIINVQNVEECKYEPIKMTFVNKFGALQSIWFFKTSRLSMETTKESYRANIMAYQSSYSTSRHQYTNMIKTGRESLSVNSGFYPESNNEVFRQLMLSKDVWIYYNNKTLPVSIESKEIKFKTSLNDSLIQYSLDLKFAYDKINNVR